MEAWRLQWDFDCLHQLTHELPGDSALYNRCKRVLNQIIDVFRIGDLSSVADCRKTAEIILGENWEKIADKEGKEAEKQHGQLWALGHW